jgi:hypothetical protein
VKRLSDLKDRANGTAANALVAAATLVSREALTSALKPKTTTTSEWQSLAWEHYDTCGELRFACEWLGNSLSRVRLFAARVKDKDAEPEPLGDDDPASVAMAALCGGQDGQSEMMKRFGPHFTVPGESFLVGWDDPETKRQEWATLCGDEIEESSTSGAVAIQWMGQRKELPDDALIIRFWRPHPRRHWEANSPVRGLEMILTELYKLTQHVAAQAESRLAGAGLLVLPLETTFPKPPSNALEVSTDEDPHQAAQDGLEGFMRTLTHAMVRPIEDRDSSSAVVPVVVQAPGDQIKNVRHISFATPLSQEAMTLRQEAIRRLAAGLDMPSEILTGLGQSNHWCVDDQTEALTRQNGWIRGDKLRVGDEVWTLNHQTGLAEWQPVRDIYRADVVDEPMRELESRTHSSLTTLNHRWPITRERNRDKQTHVVREWTTTEELTYAAHVQLAAPAAQLPDTAKYADALVELVGWFWTEGNIGRTVTIAQSHTVNADRVARIRAALTTLYGPARNLRSDRDTPGWSEAVQANESSHGGPVTVFRLNKAAAAPLLDVAPGKRPTTEFVCALTRAQLELFLDVSAQGDGHHYRAGKLDVWQRDPSALDAFELALILSGRGVSRMPSHDDGTTVRALEATTVRPVKAAEQMRRSGKTGATDQVVPYTGMLWCPVTANQTWLARRHGRTYFTGNTAWQIDEGSVKTHIEPVVQLICNALTVCYMRPIMGEDVNDSDLVVWYDASELKQRPDRSAIAKDLYELGELSGAALRREAGFGDPDAPTDEDDKRSILRGMMDRAAVDTATAVELLVLLGYVNDGDLSIAPAEGQQIGQGDEADPADAEDPRALPSGKDDPPPEGTPDGDAAGLAAPAAARALLAGHVMDYAGKRLLSRFGRGVRGQYKEVPHRELHTRLQVEPDDLDMLLEGAYTAFPQLDASLRAAVDEACRAALLGGYPLDPLSIGAGA